MARRIIDSQRILEGLAQSTFPLPSDSVREEWMEVLQDIHDTLTARISASMRRQSLLDAVKVSMVLDDLAGTRRGRILRAAIRFYTKNGRPGNQHEISDITRRDSAGQVTRTIRMITNQYPELAFIFRK